MTDAPAPGAAPGAVPAPAATPAPGGAPAPAPADPIAAMTPEEAKAAWREQLGEIAHGKVPIWDRAAATERLNKLYARSNAPVPAPVAAAIDAEQSTLEPAPPAQYAFGRFKLEAGAGGDTIEAMQAVAATYTPILQSFGVNEGEFGLLAETDNELRAATQQGEAGLQRLQKLADGWLDRKFGEAAAERAEDMKVWLRLHAGDELADAVAAAGYWRHPYFLGVVEPRARAWFSKGGKSWT